MAPGSPGLLALHLLYIILRVGSTRLSTFYGRILTQGGFSLLDAMQTYYYLLASQKFLLEDEPLDEVLRERRRHYQEQEKAIDFWLVKQPAFLESEGFGDVKSRCPQPAAAVISTDKTLITWLKLRLEYVLIGEFKAPTATLPDPLASLETVA